MYCAHTFLVNYSVHKPLGGVVQQAVQCTIQQTEVLVEMVVVAPSGQRRGFHTDTSAQRLI